MPFHYAKINAVGVAQNEDTLEQQESHAERGLSTMWTKAMDKVKTFRWAAVLILLFATLACEISILRKQRTALAIGGEVNGLVPPFSLEKRIFRSDHRYASDHTTMESINATKQHWMDLMPRGGGFLDVPDFTSYTLPPPMHFDYTGDKEVFAIAVFHEMHCLMHVSAYIDKLVMQIRNKDMTLDEDAIGHNDHCFNYLRNAIICCGDTTLEGQSQAKMFENVPGTDGTGAVHNCRNYEEISAYADKKRVVDSKEHL